MTSGAGPTSPGVGPFVRSPRLIDRSTASGRIVRRWDLDVDAVLLNETAWSVLEILRSSPDPLTIGELQHEVRRRWLPDQADPPDLEDLVTTFLDVGLIER